MFLSITQGYTCTALLLFILYCFHAPFRAYYFSLAKTANRLIWLSSLLALFTALYLKITGHILGLALFDFFVGIFDPTGKFSLFLHWIVIFIALLFKKVRQHAVWILLPIAILLNLPVLRVVWDDYAIETRTELITTIQFFLLCGLIFFLLTFAIEKIGKRTRKAVAAAENRHPPDRI